MPSIPSMYWCAPVYERPTAKPPENVTRACAWDLTRSDDGHTFIFIFADGKWSYTSVAVTSTPVDNTLELALNEIYERINSAVADGFSKKSIAALRQCLPPTYEQSFAYKPRAEKASLTQQLEKLQDTFKGTFLSGRFGICDNRLYFRYDTGDLTANENEEDFRDMREMLENAGYEVIEPLCEHDCITCTLVDKNATR